MVFGDINVWIDRHGQDANGKGTQIYNTLRDTMEIEGLSYHSKTTHLWNLIDSRIHSIIYGITTNEFEV